MKTNVYVFTFLLSALTLGSCIGKSPIPKGEPTDLNSVFTPASFSVDNTSLPREIDLMQDLSTYTMQELRLLRSYPYAIHGYHFMEADINAFFSANTDWYSRLVDSLYWAADMDTTGTLRFAADYAEVDLTQNERGFVQRVNSRMDELRNDHYVQRDTLRLPNADQTVNFFQYEQLDSVMMQRLRTSNLAMAHGKQLQLFHIYEENDYRQVPNFITTDLYLQVFHTYLSYILKSLEKEQFPRLLTDIHEGMCQQFDQITRNHPELKEPAEYNRTFYGIAHTLLTGQPSAVPASCQTDYQQELQRIATGANDFSPFLEYSDAFFPYSLFKPRGHYTRDPKLQAYFKAMMWLQTASFCRENTTQLKRATLAAYVLQSNPLLLKKYHAVYDPTCSLMGKPDNLSILDIADYLAKLSPGSAPEALSEATLDKVNTHLQQLASERNRIHPQIEITCRDKINFMPQRYTPDGEIMQELTDIRVNSTRAYPKGLDVFAALGVSSAEDLLMNTYKEQERWDEYPDRLAKLKQKFASHKAITGKNIYEDYLTLLTSLPHAQKGCPSFMQTPEWEYKSLNTALSAWAELKHDALLYSEQPMAMECGGAGPPDPIVVGYIEPNRLFWNRMGMAVQKIEKTLYHHRLMSEDLKAKTEHLANYLAFINNIVIKELNGEPLTEAEYRTIQKMGSSIEYFTLSILDPDQSPDSWSLVQGPDRSIAVVADVYTRNVPRCPKAGILHVGTGRANPIYVIVEIGGNFYLTRGAVFSYYEFTTPPGVRLTDEEWQDRLEKGQAPAQPEWLAPLFIDQEPAVNERIFYSSGC